MKTCITIRYRILTMICCLALVSGITPAPAAAQTSTQLVAIGDSIGEGVQTADAAWQTQVYSYVNLINIMMGSDLTLPYIATSLFGMVGNTDNRVRAEPSLSATNLSVSGATVASLLYDQANAASTGSIDTETDLVLFPRRQSQMQALEALAPEVIICWIGNNDVLTAATSFGQMDGSQMTPVADFEVYFTQLADRLDAMVHTHGSKVVFGNIPDVTDIGFLVDRHLAESMLGFPVALPDGSYTSIIGVLVMALDGNDNLVADPGFVLDAAEVTGIRVRIAAFNAIIQEQADRIGMPVVDVNGTFKNLVENPTSVFGIPVTHTLMGGLFSLDGVHPSNYGHGLLANEFIDTMNQAFGMNVPRLSDDMLAWLFLTDPSTDKDRDGRATGRFGVGLIETVMYILGITGDPDDLVPG